MWSSDQELLSMLYLDLHMLYHWYWAIFIINITNTLYIFYPLYLLKYINLICKRKKSVICNLVCRIHFNSLYKLYYNGIIMKCQFWVVYLNLLTFAIIIRFSTCVIRWTKMENCWKKRTGQKKMKIEWIGIRMNVETNEKWLTGGKRKEMMKETEGKMDVNEEN